MSALIVVGCGASKLDHPADAADLYTGQHYRLCLAAARSIAADDSIMILSARYGLVTLTQRLMPYDLTLGQPGAVGPNKVLTQAVVHRVLGRPVIVLASARYADLIRQVWDDGMVTAPLAHQGIGRQRATLARIRREGVTAG
jgi:hypothetical protein